MSGSKGTIETFSLNTFGRHGVYFGILCTLIAFRGFDFLCRKYACL